METFTEFLKTTECLELVKQVFGTRALPPGVADVLNGQYQNSSEPNSKLGQFIERIRTEGVNARGFDDDAYKAALRILVRAQF